MERGEAVAAAAFPRGLDGARGTVGHVAVFASAGYESDPARLARATDYFARRGARVTACLDVGKHHGRFSDTDAERLRRLHAIAADPTVDVALAVRGGYGATRLLPRIDFDAIATAVHRHGTRFVGHSDFTAIALGLLATTGAVSYAGPMAGPDFGIVPIDPFTEAHFWRAIDDATVDVEFATAAADLAVGGVLWGGNLAMVASMVGTPWLPAIDGGILFVEDVNEQPYRIERMLLSLQQAGVLDRQAAIVCGHFSGIRATPYDDGYDVDAALAYVASTTRTPIVTGLPFGHVPRKVTLAVGAPATLDVVDGVARLRQRWSTG